MGKIKHENVLGDYTMGCPQCGHTITFCRFGILVNCESKHRVWANDFLQLAYGCDNPFCEWSKVKGIIEGR